MLRCRRAEGAQVSGGVGGEDDEGGEWPCFSPDLPSEIPCATRGSHSLPRVLVAGFGIWRSIAVELTVAECNTLAHELDTARCS